ncbi:hypothetical protein QQX98_010908 [Neonectria punicea]|uniref:Portal protein n=1 Tax=Neonectria punicea TaxID=979145 RepID=A0ABR1GNB9_9HYPO
MSKLGKAEAQFLTSGGSIEGAFVMLGSQSLIGLGKPASIEKDGMKTMVVAALTTVLHPIDGANLWSVSMRNDKPNKLMQCNIMEGKHPAFFGDKVNSVIGESLMTCTYYRFAVWNHALRAGKTIDESIKAQDSEFQADYTRTETWWRMLDWSGLPLRWARDFLGGNMQYDRIQTATIKISSDIDMWNKLNKKWTVSDVMKAAYGGTFPISQVDTGGITVQAWRLGVLGNIVCPGTNPGRRTFAWLAGLHDEQILKMEQQTQQMLTEQYQPQALQSGISDAVNKAITQLFASDPKKKQLPSRQQAATVLKDWNFQRSCLDWIRSNLVRPFYPQLSSQLRIDAAFKDTSFPDLSNSLNDVLHTTIFSKLTIENGVVDEMATVDDTQAAVKALSDEPSAGQDKLAEEDIAQKQDQLRELNTQLDHQQKLSQELQNLKKMKGDDSYLKEQQEQGQKEISNASDDITQPGGDPWT